MRFKRVYIEISNICNLSCSFCQKSKRAPRFLDISEFKRILEEVRPYTDYVYFHLLGEPLLHPKIEEFFDLCYVYGLKVNLTTNGVLLKQNMDMLLRQPSLRQINISLHAATEQKAFSIDEYLENCLGFARAAGIEKDKFVGLRLWNLDENKETSITGSYILNKINKEFNYNEDIITLAKLGNTIKLSKRVFISYEKEFEWPSLENEFVSDIGICYGVRDMMGILSDGTVVPCCLDSEGGANLGNIFTQSFKEIVESERVENIYKAFSNRKVIEPLCKRCSFKTRFDI